MRFISSGIDQLIADLFRSIWPPVVLSVNNFNAMKGGAALAETKAGDTRGTENWTEIWKPWIEYASVLNCRIIVIKRLVADLFYGLHFHPLGAFFEFLRQGRM